MKVSLAHCLPLILGSIIIEPSSGKTEQPSCRSHETKGSIFDGDRFLRRSNKISSTSSKINNNKRNLATTAIIDNSVIMLGVNDGGELNVVGDPDPHDNEEYVGVRYYRDGGWYDSTAYGCKCEGFGVSAKIDNGNSFWGGSNQHDGEFNLSPQPIVTDGVTATTIADVTTGPLRIEHEFFPSPSTDKLYQVVVTLTNTDTENTLTQLRYRRVMDWDIPPQLYNECVSIFYSGSVFPTDLEYFTDDGFDGNDPRDGAATDGILYECTQGTGCGPLYDSGPEDHGALFNFLFKNPDDSTKYRKLGPGESFSFNIFYGAAENRAAASTAIAQVGAEVVSFGYPPMDIGCNELNPGSPNTFIFGFSGIGGTRITNVPSTSPLPSEVPTSTPSVEPSLKPSSTDTSLPSTIPSVYPSHVPSIQPSTKPSSEPSSKPSLLPSSDPSSIPSTFPSSTPSLNPSSNPSSLPSFVPSSMPSAGPSSKPSMNPSSLPSVKPSETPSAEPSSNPSLDPSLNPSLMPSSKPSVIPSAEPSLEPSSKPSSKPSDEPSAIPSTKPSFIPSSTPSSVPSSMPSSQPSEIPSTTPSLTPSSVPSGNPSSRPTITGSKYPSSTPSTTPSSNPSAVPSSLPTKTPSLYPSSVPSSQPSSKPSVFPSQNPSLVPSSVPSSQPSTFPSKEPSSIPTTIPSSKPSSLPSVIPSSEPSSVPTSQPSMMPTSEPSSIPSNQPSAEPSAQPSIAPSQMSSSKPSKSPSNRPTLVSSFYPSAMPSSIPSSQPSALPSTEPSTNPSSEPSSAPSLNPSAAPSLLPSTFPSFEPSVIPSSKPSSEPTLVPSAAPTSMPSQHPSNKPSAQPSQHPSDPPSVLPSIQPSDEPSVVPTSVPTVTCVEDEMDTYAHEYKKVDGEIVGVVEKTCRFIAKKDTERQKEICESDFSFGGVSKAWDVCVITCGRCAATSSPSEMDSASPSSIPSNIFSDNPSNQPSSLPSTSPSNRPSLLPSINPSFSWECKQDKTDEFVFALVKENGVITGATTKTCDWLSKRSKKEIRDFCASDLEFGSIKKAYDVCVVTCERCTTDAPTSSPSLKPSTSPSSIPSSGPSMKPSVSASSIPTEKPSEELSISPSTSKYPSTSPSYGPSMKPSKTPSMFPSRQPSFSPSAVPSNVPTIACVDYPDEFGANGKLTCAAIRKYKTQKREKKCKSKKIYDFCRVTCGVCCEDDPKYEFQYKDRIQTCEWLATENTPKKIAKICEEKGKSLQYGCIKTCEACWPSPTP